MSVAVIGAGVAGFSAAIDAAARVGEVTLFDAREHVGGRARTREAAGFLLNEGAHALYVDGPAMAFLKELGCEPPGGVPDAGGGIGVDGEETGVFPAGAAALLRTPLVRGDRIRAVRFFAGIGRLDPAAWAHHTVDETIEALMGSGRAARLGHALMRLSTYGNDPRHASGDAGITMLRMAAGGGVRYLDGGWQSVVDSLEAQAVARGVRIRTGAKIDRVRPAESGAGVAVECGGDTEHHDAVVVAVGGPGGVDRLLDGCSKAAAQWAESARPATVASLDVGLDAPWGDAVPFALGIDRPLYLSVHAPVARLAPAGRSLVHVMRYLDPDEAPDPARDRAECEDLLDRVRPGWRDDAVHVGFNRRLTAATDQARASAGGMAGRPGIAVPDAPGVFVAGDWVGPTGVLVDASVASGRSAGIAAASSRSRVESR